MKKRKNDFCYKTECLYRILPEIQRCFRSFRSIPYSLCKLLGCKWCKPWLHWFWKIQTNFYLKKLMRGSWLLNNKLFCFSWALKNISVELDPISWWFCCMFSTWQHMLSILLHHIPQLKKYKITTLISFRCRWDLLVYMEYCMGFPIILFLWDGTILRWVVAMQLPPYLVFYTIEYHGNKPQCHSSVINGGFDVCDFLSPGPPHTQYQSSWRMPKYRIAIMSNICHIKCFV